MKKQRFGESEGFTQKSWLVRNVGAEATILQAWGNVKYSDFEGRAAFL